MYSTILKVSLLLLVCQTQLTHNIILSNIYQQYLQQGVNFRENSFLGNKPILSDYDFIIIGGGSAGSVVANRLSENPNWKILLLESGDDENIYTDIPLLSHFNSLTHFNWKYKIEKNENHTQCLAMYNSQCPCPRGKGLGGSSILNYMIYTRGNRKDYESYEALGNPGWGYDSVLKYFIKSENNTSEFIDPGSHSRDGPLKVSNIPYRNLLTEKFLQATSEMGYPIYDYTGDNPATEGFSNLQATISKGQRFSASRAYLKSIKKRTYKNLHVAIFAHVTRILIDPKTKRAHSVEFQKDGVRRVVRAKKEVILSAGAINTPQILMLSGIGPEDHLSEFDINVISNLRGVGQNLDDHPSFFGLTFVMNTTNTGSTIEKKVVTVDEFLKWLKLGRGPLTVPGGVTGIGYLSSKFNVDRTWPDIELLFTIGSYNSDSGRILRKSMNIRKDLYDSIFSNINNRESWSIIPVVLRPKAKGFIKLKSKNPFKYPKIYQDFFQYKEDEEVMLDAIKSIIKLSETSAFQSIGSRLHSTPIPGCAQFEFGCDDYWKCAMRYFTSTLYHQCGTAKMGPQSDPDSVVNDQLQVYGVSNLRVVDASVFPHVPSAHLNAPVIMAAEKASDMIKETWKNTDDNQHHSGCYNPDKHQSCNPTSQETTSESYNNYNQLDNQTQPALPSTVPNQPDFVVQTTSTTTEEQQTFNAVYPGQSNVNKPSESVTYPPFEPPTYTSTSAATSVSAQQTGSGSYPSNTGPVQNTQSPLSNNGNVPSYSNLPNQASLNYNVPPSQIYPSTAAVSNKISNGNPQTYPSDSYHIQTIYPGSGVPNTGYPQQPSPNYNQNGANIYPTNLNQQQYPSFQQSYQSSHRNPANELISPNEQILFPQKQPIQNPVQHKYHLSSHAEDTNIASSNSLQSIPYYNQQFRFEIDPYLSTNNTLIPATIFLNPAQLYSVPTRYFNKRNSKSGKNIRKPQVSSENIREVPVDPVDGDKNIEKVLQEVYKDVLNENSKEGIQQTEVETKRT